MIIRICDIALGVVCPAIAEYARTCLPPAGMAPWRKHRVAFTFILYYKWVFSLFRHDSDTDTHDGQSRHDYFEYMPASFVCYADF